MRRLARSSSGSDRVLYVVPERRIPRLPYAPSRTLHLLDIENLMCGPMAGSDAIAMTVDAYRTAVPFGPSDYVIAAANPHIVADVVSAIPTALLRIGYGKDGADIALLAEVADVNWIARRYDRVVIGSGDGIFLGVARRLRNLGVAVGVVGVQGRVALGLRETAHFIRYIDSPITTTVAA